MSKAPEKKVTQKTKEDNTMKRPEDLAKAAAMRKEIKESAKRDREIQAMAAPKPSKFDEKKVDHGTLDERKAVEAALEATTPKRKAPAKKKKDDGVYTFEILGFAQGDQARAIYNPSPSFPWENRKLVALTSEDAPAPPFPKGSYRKNCWVITFNSTAWVAVFIQNLYNQYLTDERPFINWVANDEGYKEPTTSWDAKAFDYKALRGVKFRATLDSKGFIKAVQGKRIEDEAKKADDKQMEALMELLK